MELCLAELSFYRPIFRVAGDLFRPGGERVCTDLSPAQPFLLYPWYLR
jgi:hypothetical protein